MISVLILTFNEEKNLPTCLGSVGWCDDIVVYDSYSDDRTLEIAEKAGVRVFQRRFDNYADHRNAALRNVDFKYSWVLMVDADETVPPNLAKEIEAILKDDDEEICLYRMHRKDFFMGKWIRRSSGYPTWFGRLVKVGRVRVERSINEEYHTDGKVGHLKGHLHHYPFNKGLNAWIERHNKYSSMEAELMVKNKATSLNWGDLLSEDPVLKRKAIKSLVYALPGRPFLIFLALYVGRGGFLDGRAGLTFCLLRSYYEFMIDCKVKENHRRRKGLPV